MLLLSVQVASDFHDLTGTIFADGQVELKHRLALGVGRVRHDGDLTVRAAELDLDFVAEVLGLEAFDVLEEFAERIFVLERLRHETDLDAGLKLRNESSQLILARSDLVHPLVKLSVLPLQLRLPLLQSLRRLGRIHRLPNGRVGHADRLLLVDE